MKQTASVSWRTTGVALCFCLVASSLIVLLTRHNTVKPNELASSTATKWLVYRPAQRVVLVDGFSGEVLASIEAREDAAEAVAVQGPGGAFLVSSSTRTARSISSSKLRLGTSRSLDALASDQAQVGVGAAGLTAVDARNGIVDVLSVDAAARSIDIPESTESLIGRDGSVWLLRSGSATHVLLDGETTKAFALPGTRDAVTSVGDQPLILDRSQRLVRWITGGNVSIRDLPSAGSAVLQEPGGSAPCGWVGSVDELVCVGPTGIDRRVTVPGLRLDQQARFAVIDSIVVVVRADNSFERFDLTTGERLGEPTSSATTTPLDITVTNELVWIDDLDGDEAWVVQRFGQQSINKNDRSAPLFDADGTTISGGAGEGDADALGGTGGADGQQLDDNDVDDPPIAVDDEVTAGADKQSISIPVTDNDFDPDGDAIAVLNVEPGGYGETFVLNATTVVYRPTKPGEDTFSYTITDQNGNEATAEVSVEIFDANQPNASPKTKPDEASTRVGAAVEIDVLANDVDPERDDLDLELRDGPSTGAQVAKIKLGSGRFAVQYTPGPNSSPEDRFTYVAIDSTGAPSVPTEVRVEVASRAAENGPPRAAPDAARVRTDQPISIAVLQNDVDPDNDTLTLTLPRTRPPGVTLRRDGDQLVVTARPGLATRSTLTYTVSDGNGGSDTGTVLLLVDDPSVPNRPPVAIQDPASIIEGTSIEIDVLGNDTDPDGDPIVLRALSTSTSADWRVDALDGGKVLFSSTATGLTERTVVTFTYEIADPGDLRALGTVTVTISPKEASSVMIARDDPVSVRRGGTANSDVLENDTTTAEPAQLVGNPTCTGTGVTATTNQNDSVTIAATATATLGDVFCTYRVIDQLGSQDFGTIRVLVEDIVSENTPPRAANNQNIQVTAGEAATTIDLRSRVVDENPDDTLTFSRIQSTPLRGLFTLEESVGRYTPPATGPTVDVLQFTVSDGVNPPVPFNVSIDVRAKANVAPIAGDLIVQETLERSHTFTWRSRATDPGGDTGTLTATATVTRGSGASVTVDGGLLTVVADETHYGPFEARYTVTDSEGLSSPPAVIRVNFARPANVLPVANTDQLAVAAGGSGSVDVLANDQDTDRNLTVRLLTPADPRGTASLTANGIFSFTASPSEQGATIVYEYEVTDSENAKDQSSIIVTVQPCAETTPIITAPPLVVGLFDRPLISLNDYVSNGAVDPASVRGGGLTAASGRLDVPAGFEGVLDIEFDAVNSCRLKTSGSLRVQVNRAPVAQPVQRSLGRGAMLSIPVDQIGSDDEPITILSLTSAPSWVSLAAGGTVLNLSPPNAQIGGTFTFSAEIGDPGSGRVTVPITVNVTNQPPIAAPDTRTTEADNIVLDPRSNDTDPEGGDLRVVSASLRSGGAQIAVSDNGLTITNLAHGFSEITYTIVDDEGASATATIRILQNYTPETSDASFVMYDSVLEFELPAQDADGDPLTVIADGPGGFTTTVSQSNGVIRMRLEANEAFEPGTKTYFFYSVVDPFGAASESVIYLELDFELDVSIGDN